MHSIFSRQLIVKTIMQRKVDVGPFALFKMRPESSVISGLPITYGRAINEYLHVYNVDIG